MARRVRRRAQASLLLAAELSQVRSRALTAYKVGQRVRALKK